MNDISISVIILLFLILVFTIIFFIMLLSKFIEKIKRTKIMEAVFEAKDEKELNEYIANLDHKKYKIIFDGQRNEKWQVHFKLK